MRTRRFVTTNRTNCTNGSGRGRESFSGTATTRWKAGRPTTTPGPGDPPENDTLPSHRLRDILNGPADAGVWDVRACAIRSCFGFRVSCPITPVAEASRRPCVRVGMASLSVRRTSPSQRRCTASPEKAVRKKPPKERQSLLDSVCKMVKSGVPLLLWVAVGCHPHDPPRHRAQHCPRRSFDGLAGRRPGRRFCRRDHRGALVRFANAEAGRAGIRSASLRQAAGDRAVSFVPEKTVPSARRPIRAPFSSPSGAA